MDALLILRKTHRIALAAMRRNRQALLGQLEVIRVLPLLDCVLNGSSADMPKHELIMQDPRWQPENAIIVGDTEVDIAAGRFLGIRSVAVLSGVRERENLLRASPDFLVDSLASVPAIVAPSMSASRD
jgi:phosphoglycolate phosphatase